jgi:hypothetical protein
LDFKNNCHCRKKLFSNVVVIIIASFLFFLATRIFQAAGNV